MTAKELIGKLVYRVAVHGDHEVFYACGPEPGRDEIENIVYNEEHNCFVLT